MTPTLLLLALVAADVRIELVQLQSEGRLQQALDATEQQIAADPDQAARVGLHYLRGDLLDRLGRRIDANGAFADELALGSRLTPYARLRIAVNQELLGHPEVAAGLAATLLGRRPPPALVETASDLLARTLEQGGDCRLLTTLDTSAFPPQSRRALELARAQCAIRAGQSARASATLLALLEEKQTDLVGLLAARRLEPLLAAPTPTQLELLGHTFHHHRQFDLSTRLLEPVVSFQVAIRSSRDFERTYQFVRGDFWLGRFERAAQNYWTLSEKASTPRHVAQALYHRGRALELADRWQPATQSYRRAYVAQPLGNYAAMSLASALRLEWRSGRRAEALELYEALRTRTPSRATLANAALFLAASEIVQGRSERAAAWLADAQGSSRDLDLEVTYWQGRLAELEERLEDALELYLETLREDYFHPHAQLALERLRSTALRAQTRELAERIAADTDRAFDLWVLEGDDSVRGAAARRRVEDRLQRANRGGPVVPSVTVPVEQWPLWGQPLVQPEEMLLGLGVWSEAGRSVMRHFPVAEPSLALTASHQLARAGRIKDSLLIVEILHRRIPRRTPGPLIDREFRRLLHPYGYRYLIERAASRHEIDPYLLAALIREESRFDPRASSAAAARGLTQFVLTTAQQLAEQYDMGPLGPPDLEQPEIAIELGAAYLHNLTAQFGESAPRIVAAYNAGEAQAELWSRYCYTEDPAEYLSKVVFRETRSYLRKVLSGYAQYRELYGAPRPTELITGP
ncbi:MAG TPA: transglycosylase SLT domain-containing protein [Thermoanaerobaculia bacterium]|nr:transglycosylase SLT domain-containing protein [Thermoanaerobaculia bacterium]